MSQLSLFDGPPGAPGTPAGRDAAFAARLAAVHDEARALAAAVPASVRFGTSSWSFPGWAGLVYPARRATAALSREGLRDYARHPLLRTVGIDRSYYAPIPIDDLRRYADQLPDDFEACLKAPAGVTSWAVPGGGRAEPNPDYLSMPRLIGDLLAPCAAAFARHTGPIILEFAPTPRGVGRDPIAFADDLDRFLEARPREFEYAVELRDARLLTQAYRAVLARHGVAHTFNYWSAIAMPAAQMSVVPPDEADFTVVRLLLRPGTWYEDQRDRFQPFDRLVEPDDRMRDDVLAITRQATARGKRVYILVNNKAEGSSPLTVMAIAARLRDEAAPPSSTPR